MADGREYKADDLMDVNVNEDDLTGEVPGQYAIIPRRRNDTTMSDVHRQSESVPPPIRTPDMTNDMWSNFTTRDEFVEAAYRNVHVAIGHDVVLFDGREEGLTPGQLHPLLWDKYAELILKEVYSNVERQVHTPFEEREYWYSYTEFGYDVWIRLGKEYTWQKMIQGMHALPWLARYKWPMNILAIARLVDDMPRKYSLSFADFTAMMVRLNLERMMARVYHNAGVAHVHPPADTTMPNDYNADPRALFGYTFSNYMKLGFSYRELLDIVWGSFTDKERAHLCRDHPFISLIESHNVGLIWDDPRNADNKTIMYHGHLVFFARKMLLRNKAIEEDLIDKQRPWSLPHNICEMVALVPQKIQYDDEGDEEGMFYYCPGMSRRESMVTPLCTSYATFFPVLLSGKPTLYQLMERYMYLDPDYPDDLRVGTITRRTLRALSHGTPYTTVPLIFGLVRSIKRSPAVEVDVGNYATYIGDIFTSTQRNAPRLSNAPMWLPNIRNFVTYVQHAAIFAEMKIFNMKFVDSINFKLPTMSGDPPRYMVSYHVGNKQYPAWLVAHVLLKIANSRMLTRYEFTEYLRMLPVSVRGYVAAHAPPTVAYSEDGPITTLLEGNINGRFDTDEKTKCFVYEIDRRIYETVDDFTVDKDAFERL